MSGLFALVLFNLTSSSVSTDDSPRQSVGKTVRPTTEAPVRLLSEKVTIDIDGNVAEVSCFFVLLNEGPPDTIEVVFPYSRRMGAIVDFEARTSGWVEDVPERMGDVPVVTKQSDSEEFPHSKTFRVPFRKTGQQVKVLNRYWTRVHSAGQPYRLQDYLFRYILKTGAFWSGTIGEAEITMNLKNIAPGQVTKLSPSEFDREDNTREGIRVRWQFTDFEPTEDIEVRYMQPLLYQRLVTSKLKLQTDPDDAQAHFELGTVYFNQDNYESDRAERAFLKALSLDPKHLPARYFLATMYIRKTDWDAAVRELEYIQQMDPEYACQDPALPGIDWAGEPVSLLLKIVKGNRRNAAATGR